MGSETCAINKPLNVYVDHAWRRESIEHIPLLFPLWGIATSSNLRFTKRVFEAHSFDASTYRIVHEVGESDIILLPYRYDVACAKCPDVLRAVRAAALSAGKPILIDAVGDADYAISEPRSIILRYGGYRFLKRDNDIIIPPYSEDLLETYCGGVLNVRPKRARPTVCFAGWTDVSRYQYLRSFLKEIPVRVRGTFDMRYRACQKGVFVRKAVLKAFEHTERVETSFVRRSGYSGNMKTMNGEPEVLRREFVDNALNADIGLDVRGDANASTRLFELLSLGRVPAIIDTERNLPFSEFIDYRTFAIIIDHSDIRRAPDIIREQYDSFSEDEWQSMQNKARDVYIEWFRLDGMTKHLMREVGKKIRTI